jgi:N-acyl-D-aspartate/D-glutamate deacylase
MHVSNRARQRIAVPRIFVTLSVAFFGTVWPDASMTRELQPAPEVPGSPEIHDVVIHGGRVIDPESGLDAVEDVGITNGIIATLSAAPLSGRHVINASGLVVAPGFIDLDAYPENARYQVLDGVTSVLDVRRGTADVKLLYRQLAAKMPTHYGASVGYALVRREVMGERGSLSRGKRIDASETELAEILRRIEYGLDQGAVAIGMGASESVAPPSFEVLETFRTAARAGAHVVATLRDAIWAETDVPALLSEMIGSAAISGAAIHIPHLTSSGGPHTPRMLRMIELARARGLDVTAEEVPYTGAIIRLTPAEVKRFSDEDLREVHWIDTGAGVTREDAERRRDQETFAIIHNSSIEPFVAEALAHAVTSIASHGYLDQQGRGHPRTSGTYSRLLGLYVRERKLLSLMEALRKTSLMPARRLEARVPAMRNKGRIRERADADIVVFDAARIIDRATYQEPTLPSEGVRYVLVNGVVVVRDGVLEEGVYPGQAVRATIRTSPGK